MRHPSLAVIRDEHQALSAMLRSLSLILAQARQRRATPDFEVLRAMLFYIDEFPERLHHAKESSLLFPLVRERCPELALVLDCLSADHAQGEHAIRELEHALLAYEVMGESRRNAFEQAVESYIGFYLTHMAVEEREVLPAAERALTADDWRALDAAFALNRDPLTGHDPSDEYRPLFSKIMTMAPRPIGFGG